MRARFIPLLLLALVGGAVSGWTQDMEPRAYSKTPIGMNFAVAGYAYSEGGLATDPAIPLEDAHLEIHTAFTAYVRSFGLLGRSCKADVVVPYAWVSGDAIFAGQPRSRKVEGFADPRFRFAMMFIGAPAMTLKESREYRGNFVMGGSVQVAAPLGQYDKGRLVNIGGNRWWVKPELGASRSLGKFDAELAFATTIFTDNDDFLGQTREQDPIYSGQAHLVYSLRPGLWLAVDGVYYTGGRTRVNGIRGNDLQENTRVGLTLAIPVNKNNSLKFYAGSGVVTRTGTDFDTIGIAWQTRWGGGL